MDKPHELFTRDLLEIFNELHRKELFAHCHFKWDPVKFYRGELEEGVEAVAPEMLAGPTPPNPIFWVTVPTEFSVNLEYTHVMITDQQKSGLNLFSPTKNVLSSIANALRSSLP